MSCPRLCRPSGVASAAGRRRRRARAVAVRHAQAQALDLRKLLHGDDVYWARPPLPPAVAQEGWGARALERLLTGDVASLRREAAPFVPDIFRQADTLLQELGVTRMQVQPPRGSVPAPGDSFPGAPGGGGCVRARTEPRFSDPGEATDATTEPPLGRTSEVPAEPLQGEDLEAPTELLRSEALGEPAERHHGETAELPSELRRSEFTEAPAELLQGEKAKETAELEEARAFAASAADAPSVAEPPKSPPPPEALLDARPPPDSAAPAWWPTTFEPPGGCRAAAAAGVHPADAERILAKVPRTSSPVRRWWESEARKRAAALERARASDVDGQRLQTLERAAAAAARQALAFVDADVRDEENRRYWQRVAQDRDARLRSASGASVAPKPGARSGA